MKKVLFTTTALVAFAGAASADIALTGSAKMGIVGGNGTETQFFQDVDVVFTMSGETDGGLTFGAVVDLDEAGGLAPTNDDNGTRVFISGSFGTLTLGDTDGALDWALTEGGNVGNPGTIDDAETSHAAYRGNYADGFQDGQILRYDNTFGDFGVAVSVEMDDSGVSSTGYALGLKYNIDLGGTTIALGAGIQQAYAKAAQTIWGVAVAAGADTDVIGISATATFTNGLSAGINWSHYEFNGIDDTDHLQIGVGYTTGALSLHANYADVSSDFAALDAIGGTYGLAVGYDLGGGASVLAGYNDNAAGANWSMGLALSF